MPSHRLRLVLDDRAPDDPERRLDEIMREPLDEPFDGDEDLQGEEIAAIVARPLPGSKDDDVA
jgi:hypothetical protein